MRGTSLFLFTFVVALGLSSAVAQRKQRPTHSSAPTAAQKQQIEDDKQGIQKLHDADIQASLALDTATLETLWTDDIVTMAPGEPAIVGKAANAKKLESGAAALKSTEIMAFDEQWQEIRVEGDWAYEWGTMSGRMRPFSGGEETSYLLNVMRVLNRQPDGTWKIARSIYNDAKPAEPTEPAKPAEPQGPKKDPLKD